jgi:hypothetical protein
MWWRVSTMMRLAHTLEPNTIVPLPVRRQRDAKGLDTLPGGIPVHMYRQDGISYPLWMNYFFNEASCEEFTV